MNDIFSFTVFKKHFFSRKINNYGFTLVEVVVVSTILVFLMSTIWLSSSLRESDFTVMINQEKLRLLITRAKSMTLSGVVPVEVGPSCGYGVRIESNEAFIFLDRGRCGENNNQRYDMGEEVLGGVNIIILRDGVTFSSSIEEPTDIVFMPPDPRTIINGDSAINEVSVRITLPIGLERRITVNNQGLIDLPRN